MAFVKSILLLCLLLAGFSAAAADEVLLQAKRQLEAGEAQAAYDLLNPLQSERAGDPDFDFLLGGAALRLGRNTEAVFALERVLAVRPDSTPARTLIAQAYFHLKETETSRREFENVKKQDVPRDVALTIDRFLDAITGIEDAKRVVLRGFIETGIGYDSNVNSATSDSQIAVPGLGGAILTLADSSQEQSDTFVAFGGGVNLRAPLRPALLLSGGFAFSRKANLDETDFSTYYYDADIGVSYKLNRDVFTVAARLNHFFVDSPAFPGSYRNAYSGTLQWQHDFDARNQMSAFAQVSNLIYPGQGSRDANRYVGGLGYAHAMQRGGTVVYLGAYGGQENEKQSAFPQFGHDLRGIRLGGQTNMGEMFSVFVNGSLEKREYHGADPFFLVIREDEQSNVSAGLNFVPRKKMRLTPQVNYTRNASNISINEFDRWIFSIMFRQDI
ncbi:MAG: tetratricopeptide repeat protein [Burkholderiales bacterium]